MWQWLLQLSTVTPKELLVPCAILVSAGLTLLGVSLTLRHHRHVSVEQIKRHEETIMAFGRSIRGLSESINSLNFHIVRIAEARGEKVGIKYIPSTMPQNLPW